MARPATAAVRLLTGEREPVRLATTANIDVDTGGLLTIDGVVTAVGDRVLVKDQTDGSENGIRTASEGQWYRAADARTARTMQYGTTVAVQEGTANANKVFRFSTFDPVIGDDALTLIEVTYQPLDGDLTAIAALTTQAYGRSLLTLASSTALAAEVDSFFLTPAEGNAAYQPLDSDLTAIAALTTATYGRSLLTMAAAENVRDSIDAAPYVATRTAMKALDTTKDTICYLTEPGREGIFLWRAANYSAHITLDTLEGVYVKATAIASSAGAWVRLFDGLHNVKWFGAVGDGATNDKAAIDKTFAVAIAYGIGMYLPSATYKYDTAAAASTWDFANAASGFTIVGDGLQKTIISIATTLASGNSAITWVHSGNVPQYDKVIKGLSITGGFDGTILTIGNNSVADTFETSLFERFSVINSYAGGTVSEAVRLNYVLGCAFIGCRFGCYANGSGTNYGTALRARQAVFNTFVNTDYGNAIRGIDFTDFGSYGNVFIGGGSENCNWHVAIRSATATRNSWKGGRLSLWTTFAITSSGGSSNSFENMAYSNGAGPATVLDTTNYGGVILVDDRTVTQPAVPATTVAVTNTTGKTVNVRIGGGAYTVVTINGFGMSRTSNGDWTSWILPAGYTIAITYSSAPSWSWLAPYW